MGLDNGLLVVSAISHARMRRSRTPAVAPETDKEEEWSGGARFVASLSLSSPASLPRRPDSEDPHLDAALFASGTIVAARAPCNESTLGARQGRSSCRLHWAATARGRRRLRAVARIGRARRRVGMARAARGSVPLPHRPIAVCRYAAIFGSSELVRSRTDRDSDHRCGGNIS